MKPLVEKLPVSENNSFVARTHRTPQFEVPWHQHIEYELILFTEGEGSSFIGNYVGAFHTGDIFFLGANLPHTFQKAHTNLITSAVVVHFRDDCWGAGFLEMPESRIIKKLLADAAQGLKIRGATLTRLRPMIKELEQLEGFARVIRLCECLLALASGREFDAVSTQELQEFNSRNRERIDKIFRFTINRFQEPITLAAVAATADMSVPAFCSYFKKCTRKTYIDFLNELRIGYACRQLMDTQKAVEAICYESGFNTPANFHKQFLRLKKMTPSRYRKQFQSVGPLKAA